MQRSTSVPRIAFVIRLQAVKSNSSSVARIQHLAHLFRGHRVPATWSLSGCGAAQLLQDKGLLEPSDELALEIPAARSSAAVSHHEFRDHVRQSLTAVFRCTGNNLSLAAGDPELLRPRTAILADRGIRGVLSTASPRSGGTSPKLLPSGLWQLDPLLELPQTSLLGRWLPMRRVIAKKILGCERSGEVFVIRIDASRLSRANARTLQSFDALLREFSWAASCDKVALVTAGEVIAQLTKSRKVKPQQSILRAA